MKFMVTNLNGKRVKIPSTMELVHKLMRKKPEGFYIRGHRIR